MNKHLMALISLIIIGNLSACEGLVPKVEKKSMTTSVIIPCVARHFFWLSGILEAYQNQTVKPDEVVVSLSEAENLQPSQIDFLERGLWDFKLIIIRNNGKVADGQNRTKAMERSTGDILVFSDADDLPHPQRIEIAKYLFENFELDFLLHSYSFSRKEIAPIRHEDLVPLIFSNYWGLVNYASSYKIRITTGSPCSLRKVGNAIKWYETADQEYAQQAYQQFKNCVFINQNLILYRINLSSHQ